MDLGCQFYFQIYEYKRKKKKFIIMSFYASNPLKSDEVDYFATRQEYGSDSNTWLAFSDARRKILHLTIPRAVLAPSHRIQSAQA